MNSTTFGMLDGLAFVPLADVKVAMHYLRTVMPPSAAALVEYCDDNYVSGSVLSLMSGEHRMPPRFAPTIWIMHAATLSGSCSKHYRPIPLRRHRKCFHMLWARCRRRRPEKLVRQHRSDSCNCVRRQFSESSASFESRRTC